MECRGKNQATDRIHPGLFFEKMDKELHNAFSGYNLEFPTLIAGE